MTRPSFSPLAAAVLLALSVGGASAATVTLPNESWSTSFAGQPAVATINEAFTASYNLSDLSGLTPGLPIEVTFTPNVALVWTGNFNSTAGAITLDWAAQIEISIGVASDSIVLNSSFGPVTTSGGGVGGFTNFGVPAPLVLTVPWGTDLSNVSLTLTDQSTITAPDGVFTSSILHAPEAVISTVSVVPEPAAPTILAVAFALLVARRRRG